MNLKKLLGVVTSVAMVSSLFVLPTSAARATNKVVLHADTNFAGQYVTLGEGRYSISDFAPFPNDALSSLIIPSGMGVTLYEHGDFTGATETVYGVSVGNLGYFNDKMSAIEIFAINKSLPTVYTHGFFGGESIRLAPGKYTAEQLKPLAQNSISSAYVPAGYIVKLYSGDFFTGNTFTLDQNVGDFGKYKFNDMAKSIEVIDTKAPKAEFFVDGGYGGASVSLPEGRYSAQVFAPVGDNNISSVKVPAGYTVTLYENANFTGRTYVLTSSTTWVGDFNDLASAVVISNDESSGGGIIVRP